MTKRDEHKVEQFERRSKAMSIMMGQGVDSLMAKEIVMGLRIEMARKMRVLPAEWSDEKILLTMHKFRYEMPFCEANLRHESRRWLESKGFHRLQMQPWPPEGELP